MSDGSAADNARENASDEAPLAISIRDVSKNYEIHKKRAGLVAEALLGRRSAEVKRVLSGVTLDIRRGEVVGVIGKNGAGKSTLLKLIAGTLQPSAGSIKVEGRVSAILELGTGFNPAYSGRDNVVMSALMRGLTEAQVQEKLPSIVAFAGLEDAIDQPFQTYSSGMQARLAFAAAVAVEADVLIIDEALAAGDIRFTARSLRRVREICRSGVTALFVSHQTYHVIQMCSRAIWIDDGRVRMDGPPIDVCRAYEYEMLKEITQDERRGAPQPPSQRVEEGPAAPASVTAPAAENVSGAEEFSAGAGMSEVGAVVSLPAQSVGQSSSVADLDGRTEPSGFNSGEYRILQVEFLNARGEPTRQFRFGEAFRLRVSYECLLPNLPEASCGVAAAFTSADELQHVMYFNTNYPHSEWEMRNYDEQPFRKGRYRRGVIEARIPFVQVKPGDYLVSVALLPNMPEAHQFYEQRYLAYRISVAANGFPEPSVFYPMVEWTHEAG